MAKDISVTSIRGIQVNLGRALYHRPLVCGTEDTDKVIRMRIDANCVCWQDSIGRIISFHEVEGLEPKTFPSHESMLDYVLSTVERGYRVQ